MIIEIPVIADHDEHGLDGKNTNNINNIYILRNNGIKTILGVLGISGYPINNLWEDNLDYIGYKI